MGFLFVYSAIYRGVGLFGKEVAMFLYWISWVGVAVEFLFAVLAVGR